MTSKTIQRMPAAVEREFNEISRHGARVGVAFSAGADSTLALLRASEALGPSRVIALHFNHNIRGQEADLDENAARTLTDQLGIDLVTARRTASPDTSEAALRRDRLTFFQEAVIRLELAAIITGHHADDVAENLLLRIARGSGTAGLAALRPVNIGPGGIKFIRPLLLMPKSAIIAALRTREQSWREDASNGIVSVARRNAVRLEVMPQWCAVAGPDPVSGAARSRELLEEDDDALELWTNEAECSLRPGTPAEDWAKVRHQPRAVLRRLLHRHLIRLGQHASLSAPAFDKLLSAISLQNPTQTSISGGFLAFDGRQLTTTTPIRGTARDSALLPLPGAVYWPDGARIIASAAAPPHQPSAHELIIPTTFAYTLICAPRNAGQSYCPRGSTGRSRIQDMMINRKIPRELRATTPVLLDNHGPLWAPGLIPSQRIPKSEASQPALRLTWTAPRAL